MKPLILLLAPLPDFLLEPLRDAGTCLDGWLAPEREQALDSHAAEIRAIAMAGGSCAPVDLLDRLPALEIISVFGVGYDGVPVDYCRRRGIRVTNTPDVLTDDVADIALALVLMTSRQLGAAERFVRAGAWEQAPFPLTHCLHGKTAGIYGLGRIGKAIARRLEASGMRIAYHGRHEQADVPWSYCATLSDLALTSDFLIVACPGGEATRHTVDAQVLERLGPHGTLINIARGSVVDEDALVDALSHGIIRSAGLDVFRNEPAVPAALLEMEQVVLLPHVGSGTHETRAAMARLCVGNLDAHFKGEKLLTPVV